MRLNETVFLQGERICESCPMVLLCLSVLLNARRLSLKRRGQCISTAVRMMDGGGGAHRR